MIVKTTYFLYFSLFTILNLTLQKKKYYGIIVCTVIAVKKKERSLWPGVVMKSNMVSRKKDR